MSSSGRKASFRSLLSPGSRWPSAGSTLKVVLLPDRLTSCVLAITLDLSQPGEALSTLTFWLDEVRKMTRPPQVVRRALELVQALLRIAEGVPEEAALRPVRAELELAREGGHARPIAAQTANDDPRVRVVTNKRLKAVSKGEEVDDDSQELECADSKVVCFLPVRHQEPVCAMTEASNA